MYEVSHGLGNVFTDPDPDNARDELRKKRRGAISKLMTLKTAIQKYVHDGDYVAFGGFGANRTPIAACHEILRQGRQSLGFLGKTATHDAQILAAGEAFNRVDIAYVVGLEARGLSPNCRRYMESGKVQMTEWTNYAIVTRLRAAAMGVSFLPIRCLLGTDTFKFSAAKTVECPYTGKKIGAVPALYPDVSIIHVHEADVYGNCRFKGTSVMDIELARASKKLIITTERLIPHEQIQSDPSQTLIAALHVDAVCEVPYCGYPGSMPYEYYSDEEHIKKWLQVEKNPDEFKRFLDDQIYSCNDHFDYINKNGGLNKMMELRRLELLIREKEQPL
jgi:glutaconate CoA-transferase subunit A